MELLLEEHGETIIYGLVGIMMVLLICSLCFGTWQKIMPSYRTECSRTNDGFNIYKEQQSPTIQADEVIYAAYKSTSFNCKDYIVAKDYRGVDISNAVKIYGDVNLLKKGIYKLRCTVMAQNKLTCTKFINVIVE